LPLAGQHLIIKNGNGNVVGDAYTDDDGWYYAQFTATGKKSDYKVYWDQNNNNTIQAGELSQNVAIGGSAGKWANVDFTLVDPVGYNPSGSDYFINGHSGLV
jgi:hypothetical protein